MAVGFSHHAVGRRKTASARVWMRKGTGRVVVNDRSLDDYFGGREALRLTVRQPLDLTGQLAEWDVFARVIGGGVAGQAGAIRHGIARVLAELGPEVRTVVKKAGYLTRDAREVERKKYGRKGARRRFQYSKR